MESIYRSPGRVYLSLALLSLLGLWCAFRLPISLFPNSSKPHVDLCIGVDLSPGTFLRQYGESIEGQMRAIQRPGLEVERIVSTYSRQRACYAVEFKWGGSDEEALREMELLRASLQARLPYESRERITTNANRDGGGFLALSFYSDERSVDELYQMINPVLSQRLASVRDADGAGLMNPNAKQILIELNPEALATFQLLPAEIAAAVASALDAYSGGTLTRSDGSTMSIEFPRAAESLDHFRQIDIPLSNGRSIHLGDIARVDLTVPLESRRIFKTSGRTSVILFASPKPGGNVKAMAENIKAIVDEVLPSLPIQIHYEKLVDPSEFIRSAIQNVAKEVALAAGLAVLILFLFVGNIRSVATAAIEIPLSLVLSFILMRLTGVNLNLISLGGLALSAGMNVDASVVVMENIFRHFNSEVHRDRALTFEERLRIIANAVDEVRFSVIASTIASLVVFLPLVFTSDLTYAILGDLAKAVVYSHGFSAVVALILVPTIRLHLLSSTGGHDEESALLHRPIVYLEKTYSRLLAIFLDRRAAQFGSLIVLTSLLGILMLLVLPRLPREIVGKPDTDMVSLGVNTEQNTLIRQMESQMEALEHDLTEKYADKIQYTFTQIFRPNNAWTMLRLKDKRDMSSVLKEIEQQFPTTPMIRYWVDSWNPAEMPIPDPPDFQVSVRGPDRDSVNETARDFANELRERKIFTRVSIEPGVSVEDAVRVQMRPEQRLLYSGTKLTPSALSDLARTATDGRWVSRMEWGGENLDVYLKFPERYIQSARELESLPVGILGRILPFKAIANVDYKPKQSNIRRENSRESVIVTASVAKSEKSKSKEAVEAATRLAQEWSQTHTESVLLVEDAQHELTDALRQLALALSLSITLIFITILFQFGSLVNALIVLAAIPLGGIGALFSLWIFNSTLSLNSLLGIILLNGLAVANSIILVDFLQRRVQEGATPRQAALDVARARMRPILMTSMTTGLGMLPIALGLGEGGKVLQPLGIAVSGGLGFSMLTTLFVVPTLQVLWLERSQSRFRGLRIPS